jgi:hypothetical protein
MQTRSFRGSGEPAWVIASSNACDGLGPDPRRALGPAAIRAASTGRTHDRTRPMLHQRKKALVNQAPSTHDPKRTWIPLKSRSAAVSFRTEVCYRFCRKHERGSEERWNVKYSTCSTLNGLRRSGVCLRLYRRRFPCTYGDAQLRFRLYRISRLSHWRGGLDCMLRPVPLQPSLCSF